MGRHCLMPIGIWGKDKNSLPWKCSQIQLYLWSPPTSSSSSSQSCSHLASIVLGFFSLKEEELDMESPQEEEKLKESSHPCLASWPSTDKTIRTSPMLRLMVFQHDFKCYYAKWVLVSLLFHELSCYFLGQVSYCWSLRGGEKGKQKQNCPATH